MFNVLLQRAPGGAESLVLDKIKKLNILQINVEDIQQQRLSVGTKNTWLGFGKLHGLA